MIAFVALRSFAPAMPWAAVRRRCASRAQPERRHDRSRERALGAGDCMQPDSELCGVSDWAAFLCAGAVGQTATVSVFVVSGCRVVADRAVVAHDAVTSAVWTGRMCCRPSRRQGHPSGWRRCRARPR